MRVFYEGPQEPQIAGASEAPGNVYTLGQRANRSFFSVLNAWEVIIAYNVPERVFSLNSARIWMCVYIPIH